LSIFDCRLPILRSAKVQQSAIEIDDRQSKVDNRKSAMHRAERFTDTLREEIAQIVGYELEDPRLNTVTVTDVRLSSDKRAARVYVTVAGDEAEHKSALNALKHAAPYVRKQLGLSLNLPRTPELHFVRDRVEEQGERVDQLLEQIEQEWEQKERTKNSS
jgi:ribosome-binding factor A